MINNNGNNGNNGNNIVNILFYSMNCKDCATFINMLKNDGLINYFRTFCIEQNRDNIPKNIKKVPAIITTDTQQIYMGNDVFKWLQGVRYMRQQQMMEYNKKIIQHNIYKNMQNQMNAPKSFLTSEMSGVSDTFAYTDIDLAQPKSFQEYGKDDSNIIYTPPKDSSKLGKRQQENIINDIENKRKEQDKIFNENMKQGQMQAIQRMEYEKNVSVNY